MKYNLINKKFNKLTIIKRSDKIVNRKRYWHCKCDCGQITEVETSKIVSGHTKSCGCLYRDDINGLKSGKLTVIKFDNIENNRAFWICQCECGNTTRLSTDVIKSGHTKSCGCSHNAGRENCNWKGIGDISGGYWCQLLKRSKETNKDFDITKEYIWDLFLNQDKKCALTGIELKFPTKQSLRDGTASLDRIDSDIGYIKGNVQWIHKDINWMKQDFSEKYFIEMCQKIIEYRKE